MWAAPEVNGVVFTAGEMLRFGQSVNVVGKVSFREVEGKERSVGD